MKEMKKGLLNQMCRRMVRTFRPPKVQPSLGFKVHPLTKSVRKVRMSRRMVKKHKVTNSLVGPIWVPEEDPHSKVDLHFMVVQAARIMVVQEAHHSSHHLDNKVNLLSTVSRDFRDHLHSVSKVDHPILGGKVVLITNGDQRADPGKDHPMRTGVMKGNIGVPRMNSGGMKKGLGVVEMIAEAVVTAIAKMNGVMKTSLIAASVDGSITIGDHPTIDIKDHIMTGIKGHTTTGIKGHTTTRDHHSTTVGDRRLVEIIHQDSVHPDEARLSQLMGHHNSKTDHRLMIDHRGCVRSKEVGGVRRRDRLEATPWNSNPGLKWNNKLVIRIQILHGVVVMVTAPVVIVRVVIVHARYHHL
jgi:hypothetical protein